MEPKKGLPTPVMDVLGAIDVDLAHDVNQAAMVMHSPSSPVGFMLTGVKLAARLAGKEHDTRLLNFVCLARQFLAGHMTGIAIGAGAGVIVVGSAFVLPAVAATAFAGLAVYGAYKSKKQLAQGYEMLWREHLGKLDGVLRVAHPDWPMLLFAYRAAFHSMGSPQLVGDETMSFLVKTAALGTRAHVMAKRPQIQFRHYQSEEPMEFGWAPGAEDGTVSFKNFGNAWVWLVADYNDENGEVPAVLLSDLPLDNGGVRLFLAVLHSPSEYLVVDATSLLVHGGELKHSKEKHDWVTKAYKTARHSTFADAKWMTPCFFFLAEPWKQ